MPEAPPSEKAVSDITPEALLEAIGYSPEQFLAHRPPTRPPPAAGQLAVRKEDLDFIQSDRCARFYGTNPQERMFAYADKEGDRFYLNLQSVYHKNGFHDSHVFTSLHSAAQYFPAVRSARSAGRPLLAWEVVRKGRPCKGYLDVEVEPRSLWTGELSVLVPLVIEAWNTVLSRAGLPATSLQHVPITDATSADKLSAHFVFLDCWFANNAELGAFVKHVRQALLDMEPERGGSFVGQDGKRTVALDMVVFSANRGMRLIYSHKLSKHKYAERPLLPWAGNARQFDDLDYVITYMPEEWKAARRCVDVSRLPALQGVKAARVFAPYVPPEGMLNPISPKALCALVDDFEVHDGSGEPRGLGFELVDGLADSTGKFQTSRQSGRVCFYNDKYGQPVEHDGTNGVKVYQSRRGISVGCHSEQCVREGKLWLYEFQWPPEQMAEFESAEEEEARDSDADGDSDGDGDARPDAGDEQFVHVHPRQAEQSDRDASAAVRMRNRVAEFNKVFGERTDELCLPARDLVQWWLDKVGKVVEDDIAAQARTLLEKTVLPFCNHYWKLINSKQTSVVYKAVVVSDKGSSARKWQYLPRCHWVQVKLSEFRSGHLPTFRVSGKTIADQWSRWHGAVSYPGTDRLSQHARVQPHKDVFNTWTGTPIRPEHCVGADCSDQSDGGNAETFIVHALCATEGGVVGLHFWRWLCICWVLAGYRTNLCCLLFGSGGSGKSLVALLLLYLFGRELFVCVPSAASVFGNFNGQLRDKVMAWFDELHLTDMAMNDKLKEHITAEDIEINDKNEKVVHQTNCLNFGGSSNKHTVINPDHDGTRKFLLIKCQRSGCLLPEWSTPEAITRLVNTDVYSLGARMMKTVAELPADFDISKNVPQTLGLQTVRSIASGKDYVATWWTACIEGDCLLLLDKAWGQWVPIYKLLSSYHGHFEKNSRALEAVSSARLLMSRLEVLSGPLERKAKTKAQLLEGGVAESRETAKCCLLPSKEDAADAMGIDRTVDPFAETVASALREEAQAAAAQEPARTGKEEK